MIKKKPSKNVEKLTRAERRSEIKKMILKLGTWAIPIDPLAKKYKCGWGAIKRDFEAIRKELKVHNIDETKFNLAVGLKQTHAELMKILKGDSTRDEKTRAAAALAKIDKSITEHYEAWGIKDKIADKHEISTDLGVKDIREIIKKHHGDEGYGGSSVGKKGRKSSS